MTTQSQLAALDAAATQGFIEAQGALLWCEEQYAEPRLHGAARNGKAPMADFDDDEYVRSPMPEADTAFIVELWNLYRANKLVLVPSVEEVAAKFRLGDKVTITAPDWEHEPPHYITGIDWHPKHGVTYTTSEVWPPKVSGFHVCGLTDEWRQEDLTLSALEQGEA